MVDGFLKVCCATPKVKVADPIYNGGQIIKMAKEAAEGGASLVVFPELCLTGYTCGDLFLSRVLQKGALDALHEILLQTKALDAVLIVGLPYAKNGALYNCAAVLCHGELLGLVPKQNLPNYAEFYELRHFSPYMAQSVEQLFGKDLPFGSNLLFRARLMPEFTLGAELCEDLWVPDPPSNRLCAMGATIIANPSASNEVVGKAAYRRSLLTAQSAKSICAYLYADAGFGESSQDLVFCGHNLIYENGTKLAESARFENGLLFADIDLARLSYERSRTTSFAAEAQGAHIVYFDLPLRETALVREIPRYPFVPGGEEERRERCEEILHMQATGLATRLSATGIQKAVLGISGGLDSTLALIVTARAFDMLGLSREAIRAITMPCFGTTKRTRSNAELLALAYGAHFREIDISKTVLSHFNDIGQSADTHDITFENAQARERTQVLMDVANMEGGLVVGTGDLSELALGWATYNGDHMSMYGVNASIPKTLVRHLVAFEADIREGKLRECLLDILNTPVSPELLPPRDGDIAQKTEDIVGPYALHDFFLYYTVRFGMEPKKVYRLARYAFEGEYSPETIKKWLTIFYKRFFSQQFKRSCMPDGPKVGTVSLSPRGDWRMPSDASAALWLRQVEAL